MIVFMFLVRLSIGSKRSVYIGKDFLSVGGKRVGNLKRVGVISNICCGEMKIEVREIVECEVI